MARNPEVTPDNEPEFVEVYVKATGEKQTIPAEWVDHPVLWEPFRKTPLTRASESGSTKAPANGENQEK